MVATALVFRGYAPFINDNLLQMKRRTVRVGQK